MSFDNYQPSGDDILCLCKKEIAMSTAKPVTVSGGETINKEPPQPTVAGQK